MLHTGRGPAVAMRRASRERGGRALLSVLWFTFTSTYHCKQWQAAQLADGSSVTDEVFKTQYSRFVFPRWPVEPCHFRHCTTTQ